MKQLFTLFFSACICTMVMGQAPSAVIKKASVAPVIDGTVDDVWSEASENAILLPYTGETPTVGPAGTTWWKALWTDKGIFVLVNVNDNVWGPAFGAANDYKYDHPEVYFDVNYLLKDQKGPQTDGNGLGNGHYQIAPQPVKDSIASGVATSKGGNGSRFSYNVTDPTYLVEYFVPFTKLKDSDGIIVAQTATIGFDVTICDNDIAAPDGVRNRQVWSNIGTIAESWVNMDDCGTITLEGATDNIFVESIIINPAAITANKTALQLTAAILPDNATNKILKWTVENGTGSAKISSTGLLTPMTNGTVTVKAVSTDGGWTESDPITINISGQVLDKNDIWNTFNLIQNWNFNTDITSWGGWWDGATQIPPVVQEGVVVMQTDVNADGNNYHYQFNQSGIFTALPNIPYTFKFKSWSSDARPSNAVDFEDTSGNSYNRYGASTDAEAINGRSEWHYATTTDPTWYTFHVTFDQIIPSTVQKIQWMESMSTSTVYLDSVLLISDADIARIGTKVNTLTSDNNFRVLPNPVVNGSLLTVDKLASTIKNVSIYNALGQKLMEKVPYGNMAKFDVSSLRKGMYLVKLSDGSSQKFIK